MISPAMFKQFCVPHLTEQCGWCDHTFYHLDGSQCISCSSRPAPGHRQARGVIEWTPDPQVPSGGDRRWWEMYRHIKSAGKSVQLVGVTLRDIAPLLDGVGPEGMYLLVNVKDWKEAEVLEKLL